MRTFTHRNRVAEVVPVTAVLRRCGAGKECSHCRGLNVSKVLIHQCVCSVFMGHIGRLDAQLKGETYRYDEPRSPVRRFHCY